MTRRLYYEDAYTTTFEATVVAVEVQPEGRHAVVLDATYFYPTSGGQMHDLGRLDAAAVVDVIDEDTRIVHVVEGAAPVAGARVRGAIDAERRRHHRQQHTGQHVLSRIVEDRLGLPTLSSRLGETGNTLDLGIDGLDESTLDQLEDATNRVLWEGHEVTVHLLDPDRDAERLQQWGLRSKNDAERKDRAGVMRVIEVEGVDRCACGGTHVRHTAEIGLVAITGVERVKGGVRVHFLCGERAVHHRRERNRWLDRVARRLTSGSDQVEALVARLQDDAKERQKRLVALARELVAARAPRWIDEAPVNADGLRIVVRRLDADEALAASEALRAVILGTRTIGAVLSVDGEKGQIAVARSGDLQVDCRELLAHALAGVGGRGGGQPEHARGGCPGNQLDAVERALRAGLLG